MPEPMSGSQHIKRGVDRTTYRLAIVGIVVLVNILAISWFARVDLTADGLYSLSDASRATVENLDDPISVRAYFTSDLPAPYSSTSRYVKDLLDEYATYSHGMLRYQFIDPVEFPADSPAPPSFQRPDPDSRSEDRPYLLCARNRNHLRRRGPHRWTERPEAEAMCSSG